MTKVKKTKGLHLFRKKDGTYYLTLVSKNGRELMRSVAPFTSKANAVKNIRAVAMHFELNNLYYDHTTKEQPHLVAYP